MKPFRDVELITELPDECWRLMPKEGRRAQYYTEVFLGPIKREVMLDRWGTPERGAGASRP